MKISIVIPAHNEEGNLRSFITDLVPVLEKHEETRDYELLIVNDSSTDGTQGLIEHLAERNPRIRPLERHSDTGFGNAVKEGNPANVAESTLRAYRCSPAVVG